MVELKPVNRGQMPIQVYTIFARWQHTTDYQMHPSIFSGEDTKTNFGDEECSTSVTWLVMGRRNLLVFGVKEYFYSPLGVGSFSARRAG